jgi:hypothetical protein
MATLSEKRKSTISAERTLFFLEVEPSSNKYYLMNIKGDASTTDTGVETEDVPDVTSKVQGVEVSSYSPSHESSQPYLTEDEVCQFYEEAYRNQYTASDAHRNMIEATFDGKTNTPTKAYLVDVTVQVTSFPNEAGSNRRVEATLTETETSKDVTSKVTYDADNGVITYNAG